ncbi:hypothetical protein BEWA_039510 [Theileria equi strain WA]|uniref:RRM domain-containing protein n=1 Tax=Theileria equi strain WA TaxID=1537102 RepID=L1LFI6_THEEQ|nr:hypothetical protein BEWA_039510 [Theileria equi strain WA]EKX73913.1 hypothetical protein BEWA_039510 [Theileria equi strain WA]|eukprot:XP_004833365.1 hypothetical protein BEWA_039510 [Theileria equi strain WA]
MAAWEPISSCNELKKVLVQEDENEEEVPEPTKENEQEDDEEEETKRKKREKKKQYLKRKKQRIESGQWVDSSKVYSVYISGLPKDTTVEEVSQVFKRAGVIKIDPITTLPKVKLYTDEEGNLKSDATVTFVNQESVDLALRYFDNSEFRTGYIIHVEKVCMDNKCIRIQAKYEPQKGKRILTTDPEMRKKYLAAKYEQERLQSWGYDMDDGTDRRIVISKPMFSTKEAEMHEADSDFYKELQEEIHTEVAKYVEVEKVTPIPRHPQGIVCIKFKTGLDAQTFISKFNNRMFDGRQLDVYFFDGKTDLKSQAIPSKAQVEKIKEPPKEEIPTCVSYCLQNTKLQDWIDEQSSDEEFEIRTE